MKWLLGTSLILLLCLPARADVFVRDDIVLDPTPDRMSICHGNGCVLLSQVSLASGQWQSRPRKFGQRDKC